MHGRDRRHHIRRDLVRAFGPSVDHLVVLFALRDQAVHVLLFELFDLIAHFVDDWPFGVRDQHIVLAERNAGLERLFKAQTHDLVAEDHRFFLTAVAVDSIDDSLHVFLAQQTVDQIERCLGVQRHDIAQAQAAGGGIKALPDNVALFVDLTQAGFDLGVQVQDTSRQSVFHFVDVGKGHAFPDHTFAFHGDVIDAQNHVLRRNNDRCAVGGRQNVVGRHHQHAGFQLGFQRKRHVHGHLVAVKVGVKGRADQRVQLNGLTFDQDRLERLDAQTVQGRCAVQQNGMFADDFIQDIPNFRTLFFHQLLGLLDGRRQTLGFQTRVDEGLEQL